jgi:hypothetical protein
LYSAAVSVSQDNSLRKSVRESLVGLLDNIGTAQMEQEIVRKVTRLARDNQQELEEQTGVSLSTSEDDIRQYVLAVVEEKKKLIAQKIKTAAAATKQTIESLVTKLRLAGATVQISSEKPLFNTYGSNKQAVILVNGETVQVFEYIGDSFDVADKRLPSESLLGSRDHPTGSRPHIYRVPELIVRYLGDNLSITNLLEGVLGKQVGERIVPTEKDMEDARRLERDLEKIKAKKQQVNGDLEKPEREGTEDDRKLGET